ncbi:MAG: TRAP transporter small permease [Pseudomonadota bacterium]
MYKLVEQCVGTLARILAGLGGLVLVAVVLMTCISILGRNLIWAGLGPIQGDFELVEIGVATAVFAFLPWCQFSRGHARVDLFANRFGPRLNRVIDLVADIAMAAAALLIAQRLWVGLGEKISYSETTFILEAPVWWGYATGFTGALAFAIVAVFCIWRSARTLGGWDV